VAAATNLVAVAAVAALIATGVVPAWLRPGRLADRLGERHEIVGGRWGWLELAVMPDQVPAARRGQAARVLLAQVVGVRFGEGSERTDDGGRVRIDIGQRGNGRPWAAVAGTTPW
jgi:hypothetical protein